MAYIKVNPGQKSLFFEHISKMGCIPWDWFPITLWQLLLIFLEQQDLPLLEEDQTREHLKHIGACDLVAHSLRSFSWSSFLEESKFQPQKWARRKIWGKTDTHKLTRGSKAGDHEDDELGEEVEVAGTNQPREA